MITGTSVIPRSILSASDPSRSGSPRSRMTTSKRKWATSRNASRAVPTLRTVWEASESWRMRAERTNWSSSTTSTLAMGRTVRHSGERASNPYPPVLPSQGGALWAGAKRTRSRPGLVARHRRGGHPVLVGSAHGAVRHGLRPSARAAAPGRCHRGRTGHVRQRSAGLLDAKGRAPGDLAAVPQAHAERGPHDVRRPAVDTRFAALRRPGVRSRRRPPPPRPHPPRAPRPPPRPR